MKYWILSLFLLTSFTTQSVLSEQTESQSQTDGQNKIQIALLLDTSNSMDGLIEQAKGKLWSIVNEFSRYEKGDTPPQLEIALFEYGNDGLKQYEDWIRQITSFTTDLDFISEKLFELTTYGGSEYCGGVIHDANQKLEWSNQNDDLKLIFIAGNEIFSQGRFSYRDACHESVGKGIAVNTIFCGGYEEGIRELWKEGATLGKGKYINIDQNREVSYIETPYDSDLEQLNNQLNDTYIYYGSQGVAKQRVQVEQDHNAKSYSRANAAERTVTKASGGYSNTTWDLVDAYKANGGDFKALEIERQTLPAELNGKTEKEIEAYVLIQKEKREEIKKEVSAINKKRMDYINKQAKGSDDTLDGAIRKAVESLAISKGYKVKH